MGSMNKVILIGRLGQDPVVRTFQGGGSVCAFSIATDNTWKDKNGQKQSKTTWHQISVFGKAGDVCAKYLSKGSSVAVEGRYESDQFTDKNGVERTSFKVIAENVQFLGGGNKNGQQRQQGEGAEYGYGGGPGGDFGQFQPPPTGRMPTEDDIPF